MGNGRSHTLTFLLIFSFLFVLQPSLAQGKDVTQISKEEILADYCEVLRAEGRENMSESVNKLFSIARSMVVESREIKGVTQTWAIGVRSLRNSLLRATDEELKRDKSKISTLASEFEPSLTDSVCEWARMLGQDDPGKANSYARWEVVGNINKIGESVESEFYRELLAQLKELAGTKIPDMTEEEAEEEIADTLEEVKVCKEGCQFAELQKAVSAAKSGGLIAIEAGTYDVNGTIEKDLTVKGVGREQVRLQGKEEGHPVLSISSSASVNLSGLTVQFALEREGDDNCASKAKDICPHGIAVKNSARLELDDVTVRGNWKGVRLSGNASGVVTNSLISRNSYYGFHLSGNSTLEVTGSIISEGNAGVYLEDYAVAEFSESTMEKLGNGFFLWDGSSATVKNCKLEKMEFGAFLNDRAEIKLINNEVSEVESFTFNTPVFFSGKIEKSGNTFLKAEPDTDEAKKEPMLEILGCNISRGEDWVWVKGRARNVSGNDLIIAEVKGFFYDGQDNLVTTMPATTVGLGDGELWDFEISVYVDPQRIDRVVIKEGDCSSGNF